MILGGHEHDPLDAKVGKTLILKTGSEAVNLGRIDLLFSTGKDGRRVETKWELIAVTDGIPEKPEVAAVVKFYESRLGDQLKTVAGTTSVPLDTRNELVRVKEAPVGNLIADTMREAMQADAALVNGGGIRGNAVTPAVTLTRGDVLKILPFANKIVKLEVTGDVLRAALENCVSQHEKIAGRFPQVSGIRYVFDPKKPAGSRQPNEVFITAPVFYHTLVATMLNFSKNGIKFMLSPKAYVRCTGRIGKSNDWITPAVDLSTGNLPFFYRTAKRCMDIIVSAIALIAFLPLFMIIPNLIKLTSRGPVFYTQMRAGHNGQPFKIYKFRSMVVDAEKILQNMMDFDKLKEPVFKFHDDPRVTFIGSILRKTSIDELPQLFNVLEGDLSLVGPRPEEITLVKRYESFFRERLKVKPGITGLQQITCRGSTSMKERMKYDLQYIKKHSLWLDIKIRSRN